MESHEERIQEIIAKVPKTTTNLTFLIINSPPFFFIKTE